VALNFHLETSLRLLRVLESTHLNKLTKIPNSLRLQTTKRGRDTDSQTEKRGEMGELERQGIEMANF
jgi:hypothetical protein